MTSGEPVTADELRRRLDSIERRQGVIAQRLVLLLVIVAGSSAALAWRAPQVADASLMILGALGAFAAGVLSRRL